MPATRTISNRRFRHLAARPARLKGRRAPGQPLDMLQAILSQMSGAASLLDLLERTVGCLDTLMGNSSTAVLQLMPGGATLRCQVFRSASPYHGLAEQSVDAGLIGVAARLSQTVLVKDTLADPRFVQPEGWAVRSELCVPIVTRHGLWGVLNLDSDRPDAYSPRLVQ